MNKKPNTLKPVRPNAGIRAIYHKRLKTLIDCMHRSVIHFICICYRQNLPEIIGDELPALLSPANAHGANLLSTLSGRIYGSSSSIILAADALPANKLKRTINSLSKRWRKNFKERAQPLAEKFSKDVSKHTDNSFKKALKDKNILVKFKLTPAQKDILKATVEQNVTLIKSIPEEYLTRVQGSIMRAIQTGRDLKTLTDEIEKSAKIARNRAAIIARDQVNKATASLHRARQIELGITEALWLHSGAGKKKRPTHVKNSGKKFNVKTGWYDPAAKQYIMPGELINCKCISKSIIPGLS